MRIGKMAAEAAVNVQTLRYYERRGLLEPPSRLPSGYREYDDGALQRVRFIRRAQDLGFTLQEIADLLSLEGHAPQACRSVAQRASRALERIDEKIGDLQRMRRALASHVTACRDHDPHDDCPLLGALGVPGSCDG
jgi:MerR family transcriptional regulator, copper efflux regulator